MYCTFGPDNVEKANNKFMGRGGGQVVCIIAFYSDNPSSNPADAYSFFWEIYVWKERK